MSRAQANDLGGLLRAFLADPETGWSLGSFGALAEFSRDEAEPVREADPPRIGLATVGGAIAFDPSADIRPVAYETAVAGGWSHGIALCLAEEACGMARRGIVTEIGPDVEAVRPQHRSGVLFDLGLNLRAVDACLRTQDARTMALLRASCGRPLFEPGNPAAATLASADLHRVFLARAGRIEVFGPVPPPGGADREGPRTFLAPGLLRLGRTHAATTPIPSGLVPFGAIHPPHPSRDRAGRIVPFDRARHDAFRALLERWGAPDLVAMKRRLEAGGAPLPGEREKRHAHVRRVVEAQRPFLSGGDGKVASASLTGAGPGAPPGKAGGRR